MSPVDIAGGRFFSLLTAGEGTSAESLQLLDWCAQHAAMPILW